MKKPGELSLGEAAKRMGLPVMEFLKQMKGGSIKYSLRSGGYAIILDGEQPLLRARREELYQIIEAMGEEIEEEFTPEGWEEARRRCNSRISGIAIPSAEEIPNACYPTWTDFVSDARKEIDDRIYRKILDPFLRLDKQRSTPHDLKRYRSGGENITELILRDLKNITGIGIKRLRGYLMKFGLLDGGYIADHLGSIDALTKTAIEGTKMYSGEGKQKERDIICKKTEEVLPDPKDVRYLGMPSVNFIDYCLIAGVFGVVPGKSLAVEKNRREANIMQSITRNCRMITDGEIFEGLEVYNDLIEDTLGSDGIQAGRKFNFIFLDYQGSWSPGKKKTLINLFERDHISNHAVFYITLNEGSLETWRYRHGRGYNIPGQDDGDQVIQGYALIDSLCDKFGYGYTIILDEGESRYKDTESMFALGFLFERKKPVLTVKKD